MVILLNLLPLVILLALSYWAYRRYTSGNKKIETLVLPAIIGILLSFLYTQVQPSYVPKGEVKRTQVVPFEQKEHQVKDVILKPLSGEVRDERISELYNKKLPFIENKPLTKDD